MAKLASGEKRQPEIRLRSQAMSHFEQCRLAPYLVESGELVNFIVRYYHVLSKFKALVNITKLFTCNLLIIS